MSTIPGEVHTNWSDPLGLIPPGWARSNLHHQPVPATDAERGAGLAQATFATGAMAAAAAPFGAAGKAVGAATAVLAEIIHEQIPKPDGDNDNDGIPDAADDDDDNDGIPDVVDPNALIPCSPMSGECESPARNSCEE